ncbi:MAG: hypothetical protein VB106_02125 [Clostridiaceae bacterium]|nr:hypothetical protein [Clostridiaceae bacterium]
MNAIQALVVLLMIFTLGEIVADKTKAALSTTLVIAVVLMVGFWCGLPVNIFDTAMITAAANVLIGLLITSLGTMIDFPELKRQWKVVIISFLCVVVGVVAIIVAGTPLIGRTMALAGAPIFAGANTATLVMTKALDEMKLPEVATFCVLILVTQNFMGIPIASFLLRKEARRFLTSPESVKLYAHTNEAASTNDAKKVRKLLQLPDTDMFNKPSIMLTKLAIVAGIANYVAGFTGGRVHYFVVALLAGILFAELGFLDRNILPKTQSSGFIIFATTMIIFTTLAKTTPGQMINMIGPLILTLGIGALGVILCGALTGKLLNVSPYLAISLGLSCTFGFPTTMLMPKEVANAMGETPEQKAAIENYLMPKMITGGFVTVTILSVLLAGVIVKML